jgi:hypothetical protein
MCAISAFLGDDAIERVGPFFGFLRIEISLPPRDFPYLVFRIVKSKFTSCNIVVFP